MTALMATDKREASLSEKSAKFLTFRLGIEEYGLQIMKVQEIIRMQAITKVPRTPAYVKGVINLRGKVIPVINLRARFALEEVEETEKTCIIVVQIRHELTNVTIGAIVDEVSEVVDIPSDSIETTPLLGAQVDTAFIMGIAKGKTNVRILLDIDKVLSRTEIDEVKAVPAAQDA